MLEPQIYCLQERRCPGFELLIIVETDNVNDTGHLEKKVFCLLVVHNGAAL